MRKDVKAGMAFSVVIIVLAGWYYTREESVEPAIPLTDVAAASGEEQAAMLTGAGNVSADPAVEETGNGVTVRVDWGRPEGMTSESDAGEGGTEPVALADFGEADAERSLLFADRLGSGHVERGSETVVNDEPGLSEDGLGDESHRATNDAVEGDAGVEAELPKPMEFESGGLSGGGGKSELGWDARAGGAAESYTIQEGDTLAILAEVYYGSQRFTKFLADANPQISDDRSLRVGSVIVIPELPEEIRRKVMRGVSLSVAVANQSLAKEGEAVYVVRAGDSFYSIATKVFGSGSRWPEIYELNKDVVGSDPSRLRAGQSLRIPSGDHFKK